MLLTHIRRLALPLLALTASAALPGCYAEEGPPAAYAYGYAPQYYDGYVVYYDSGGVPFYHVGGVAMGVPRTSPFYGGLVTHWRANGYAYGQWTAHYGGRYRGYRSGGGGYRR